MPSQAEGTLRAPVESFSDPVWSVDGDGHLLAFNRALRNLIFHALQREVTVGMRFDEILGEMAPQSATLWHQCCARALRVGAFKIESTLLAGHAFNLHFSPIEIGEHATGISVFGRSLGAHKQNEEMLRHLAAAIESSQDAFITHTLSGKILSWNRAAEQLSGFRREDAMGRSIGSMLVDCNEEQIHETLKKIAKNIPVPAYDAQLQRKDGTLVDVSVTLSPVRDESGNIVSAATIVHDIGERKKLDRALADSEARFRHLFKDSGTVMLVIEPESGEITGANHAAEAFYGYPREKLVGANIALLNTLPADQIKKERVRALREQRNYFSFEHRLASGEIRDVQIYASPVLIAGQTQLYSIIFDVTQQKKAERELRETLENLAAAQRIGGLGNYDLDLTSGLWRSSEVLDEIFGIESTYPHTVEGWHALLHPADRTMMIQHLHEKVIGEGRPFDKQYRIVRHSDGAERWVHGWGKLEFNADGNPVRMRGAIKDITRHRMRETALRASQERYRSIFQMSIDDMVLTRLSDGIIIDVNHAFTRVTGFSHKEALGKTTIEMGLWESPADRTVVFDELRDKGACHSYQCNFRRKDNSLIWGAMSLSLVEVEGETCALSITRDITHIKQAEINLAAAQKAMRTSEERYRTIFQTSLDCIAISRLSNGTIIDVNQAYLDLLGFRLDEVLGQTCLNLSIWVEPALRERMAKVLLETGSFRDTRTRFRKRNGDLIWVMISASSIEIEGELCSVMIIRDISDAKAAEDKIWNLAFYDPLTRLPNRRLLMDRLRQVLAAGSRSLRMRALLFIDLDNFKTLNDSLGHQNGDELLREVAQRLVACVRSSDTVARLGGDEFVVLLDGLDYHPENAAAHTEEIARKILETIEIPFSLGGREHFSTSSIGITIFGGSTESANELLQQADIAMYQAKSSGRNTLRFFEPALQTAVRERALLIDEMRMGIKHGEFVLYLQPLVGPAGMTGAEALIRWLHPRCGLLLPGEFIPLAEETGLILPLGDFVLEAACRKIADWQRQGVRQCAYLSVNISARQFYQPGFVDQILDALDRNGTDPTRLTLEITESILLDNVEEAIQKMLQLKQHGVRFSLDDFGTGYSSLSYLKKLPFNQLKIDQSFVHDLLSDLGSRAIAQTVISLGRALDLDVLAEGVETTEQRIMLEELGCRNFQGYLFDKPMPLEDFEARWLTPCEEKETRAIEQ